jgi:serine/threonine protein kinase
MRVLILTIQEDPPSLDTYVDDEDDSDVLGYEPVNEVYSAGFRALVAQLLQKDPSRRPTCHELLTQNPLLSALSDPVAREARKESMRSKVCDLVRDVGATEPLAADPKDMTGLIANLSTESSSSEAITARRGNHRLDHTPVSIMLSQEKGRPAGTSWVFPNGSQILASTAISSSVDDVMAQLDEFGKQTGGEHYARGEDNDSVPSVASVEESYQELESQLQPQSQTGDSQEDDLEEFMNDFERTTGGENFRPPNSQ